MNFKLLRQHDQAVVVKEGRVADRFFSRLVGLIGTKTFPEGQGVLFPRCNDIHMWMMSIPIDVVFLKPTATQEKNKNWEIVKAYSEVKPWRPLPLMCFSAKDTLELPAGTVNKFKLKPGEVLCIAS